MPWLFKEGAKRGDGHHPAVTACVKYSGIQRHARGLKRALNEYSGVVFCLKVFDTYNHVVGKDTLSCTYF